jgi:hypothetical protein
VAELGAAGAATAAAALDFSAVLTDIVDPPPQPARETATSTATGGAMKRMRDLLDDSGCG